MNIHNDERCNKSKIFDISIIQNDEEAKNKTTNETTNETNSLSKPKILCSSSLKT